MRPSHLRSAAPALALLLAASSLPAQQQPILGFPSDAVAAQARREAVARAVPSPDTLRERMRLLSEQPHEAGTDRSRRVAEMVLQRFRSFGLDAEIERFEALMPRPVTRTLELLGPDPYTARLDEPPVAGDKDSDDADQLPTYNAYSADGDVTGELVYVNYGVPADYRTLDSLGISVRGKIVIARYGGSWRGIKQKVAYEHGAIGCIIYSDPRDDGYWVGDVYPTGPMRPEQGVQRGSVMDMPVYPGDPLSPGWASEAGSRRLSRSEAVTLVPLPVLPISYGDALPLLRSLAGPVAPESWRGALPLTYHVGPSAAKVHLALKFDWATRPLYDVIARVPGARAPDQWVVFGNHHDAWVNGAEDPISGLVSLEEAARAVGALLKTGWRPARTLVFAAWDGEEWGLLGSTEWAEKHAAELDRAAVVYLNSDTNSKGWLEPSGSHSLEEFVRQLARDVRDPVRDASVLDASIDHRLAGRVSPDSLKRVDRDTVFSISALGSGSDYSAFLDHLGVASLNLSYGGDGRAGIYHSTYDSFDFYRRFLDPTFQFEALQANTMVTALLRLADAPVLPFEFTRPARTYRRYADEIAREAAEKDETRALDLARVYAALDRVDSAAARYGRAAAHVATTPSAALLRDEGKLAELNRTLYRAERQLTEAGGLEKREWFRHLIYAPGFYTGYGVKTMPGIREAVEDRPAAATAQREAARVAEALGRYAESIEKAAALLETMTVTAPRAGRDWPESRGDKGASRYSPLTQIDRDNVSRLKVAWVYHTGDAGSRNTTVIENTPVVVDDVLYLTTANRKLVALEAGTGREIWKLDFRPTGKYASYPNYHGPSGLNRGVALWTDEATGARRVLLGTTDGRLLSVDARTGKLDPAFGEGGTVDLRAGAGRELETTFYGLTSPPGIYRDIVILGVSNGEGKRAEAPGDIRAFDVRTGEERWRFHTIPHPGEPGHAGWRGDDWRGRGGANAWGGVTIDEERGLVFAGTGSATYDFYGADRKGPNLYANSILALDATTGKLRWHFQTVHHDIWDYDLATPPNLVTVRRDGKDVPAVAQVTKTGFVFVLDRLTGEPLFPMEERPVPASIVPGEELSPTQPFPTRPAPLARQTPLRRDEVGGVTPEHDRFCKALFDQAKVSGGIFTPLDTALTLSVPGTMGGADWSGASFDPITRYLYVSETEAGAMGTLVPGGELGFRRVSPPSYRFWEPDSKWSCQPPPWGTLNAIDLDSGEIVWRVPLGAFDALTEKGIPPTGTPNLGGSAVTAGGLVFIASTMDARFRAFDARTGQELWSAPLPAAGYAAPAVYQTSAGKQFVVIAAGGGGKWGTPSGDAFVAFALEEF